MKVFCGISLAATLFLPCHLKGNLTEQADKHELNDFHSQQQFLRDINPSLSFPLFERSISYFNHKLIEITGTRTPPADNSTYTLPQELFKLSAVDGFQLWEANSTYVKALVNPSIFLILANLTNLSVNLLHTNVQELIDRENFDIVHTKMLKTDSLASWLQTYHTYDDTKSFYMRLASLYPTQMEYIASIGQTSQGRDIFAVKIGNNLTAEGKKIIYIQALQHAREWIAGSTINYFTYSLLTTQSANMANLLDKVTFVIVPIVNPDGYDYTWTNDRLWRKNRKAYVSPYVGVDLNRNWDSFYGTTGASVDPLQDTYQGPYAASEAEVQACQTFLRQFFPNLIGALDIHNYSQLLLWPWSYTSQPYIYRPQHVIIGQKMTDAIKAVSGKLYVAEDSSTLYPSGGAAQDYFCDTKFWPQFTTIPYAFTIELRPKYPGIGAGFIVPQVQIIETGQEMTAGILAFAEHAYNHPIIRSTT